jgi:stalled ribosome rescue protein Dom34
MIHQHFHAVIWIDHHEARVFHFNAIDVEHHTLHPNNPAMHIHHKANTIGSGHETLDQSFLHETSAAVATAGAVLIVGPGSAKTELAKHITQHDPKLKEKILGVETVDHPTDGQIVAYARKFFKSADRMQPQL